LLAAWAFVLWVVALAAALLVEAEMTMAEPKPLASLSAGLLARKGGARPAMRRQAQLPAPGEQRFTSADDLGWNDMGYDVDPHSADDGHRSNAHGLSPMASLNTPDSFDGDAKAIIEAAATDIGHAPAPQPIAPHIDPQQPASKPEVLRQHDRIAREIAVPPAPSSPAAVQAAPVAVVRKGKTRAQAGSRGNFAFTLRLDPDRHLRLRLASATKNKSVQQILIGLVDDYLNDQPHIAAFAAEYPNNTQ
jgi:hypothetical protein